MASNVVTMQQISHLAKTAISKKLNPATGADWRQLAGHLKFTDVEIQNFEGRNGARPDYNPTLEVLRQWEQRFTHGPPLRELINVLKEMERLDTIGVIDDMLDNETFWDVAPPSIHSRHSSGGSSGSPMSKLSRPSFPQPPSASFPPADEAIFKSELDNESDGRREPVEHSFGSLDSGDYNYHGESGPKPLPPHFQDLIAPPQPHNSQTQSVRPKVKTGGYANSVPRGNPAPFTPSPEKNRHQSQSAGNSPISNVRSNQGQSMTNTPPGFHRRSPSAPRESQTLPKNLLRTNSWEKTHPTTSFDTNTWPSGGKKVLKENNNPHAPKETSSSSTSIIRPAVHGNPGDYGGTHPPLHASNPSDYNYYESHREAHSMPLPQRSASYPQQEHRQVGSRARQSHSLQDASQNVKPAPHQCPSGIAYGITFAWKDWKCGMDLAKKLKREGHHVEVDRKARWYDNVEDRNQRLPKVFNSCRYIIVIITPDYEKEIAGNVDSPINTKFIHEYMLKEYERNGKENLRFIPIVDASRIQQTEEMFRQYPVDIHQYIIRLILRQGPPRPQNRGVVVERQYSVN